MLAFLTGCSSRGPMQSFYGPAETPQYSQIMESVLYNNEQKIEFVADATSMPEYRMIGGAITITPKSFMFAQWNGSSLTYNPVVQFDFNEIENYGSYPTLNVPLGLIGKAFYIKSGKNTYYFASGQLDSVFYYIKSKNKNAIRIDS